MLRIPVESSDIVAIGYDPKTRVLEVEFRGERVYQYKDVEPEVHEQFMRAESYGRFFSSFIDRRYRYERVDTAGNTQTYPEALAFVTGNARKARDLQLAFDVYGLKIEQLKLPVDEIQSTDATDIAVKKAKHAYALARRPVVVNDVFWNILALRGFPGAYMNEVARWFSADDWLSLMADKQDRTVCLTDTLAYYDGTRVKTFAQDMVGTLATEPRGKSGSPFDQLLILQGQTKTVAEIEDEQQASSFDIAASNLAEFAKWFNMQRRLGKG